MRFIFGIFPLSHLALVWVDLVVYQVSTFYYVWNWSKSLWWVVVVVVCKPIIVVSLSSS